ncbi:MAG: AraC family transcriptional regulator ligand-binding domain-containing protein [Pseudomarimonas sp.]
MSSGTTTSITVRFLIALLEQAGLPQDALLHTAGVSREQLTSPELQFPVDLFDALWARAASTQADIGLRLIDQFPSGQMHVVTHLALRCATVGDALESVSRYMRLTDVNDRFSLHLEGDVARFTYSNRNLDSGDRHNPWIVEHFLSMCCVLMTTASGRELPLRDVQFNARAQAPITAYRDRFGMEPRFDTQQNSLTFHREAMSWPLQTHDHYLRTILEQFANRQLPAVAEDLVERAAERMRRSWLSGKPLSLEQLAKQCGTRATALRARLAEAGLSFRQLKDDSRRDLAQVHLAGQLAIGEIAYLLGFSEPAALQHAVKRWFGMSAGEFRRVVQQSKAPSIRSGGL